MDPPRDPYPTPPTTSFVCHQDVVASSSRATVCGKFGLELIEMDLSEEFI